MLKNVLPTDRNPAELSTRVVRIWLLVLILANACSYVDRQILSLMVDDIRADLAISNTQFSLLHGLSFALLYSTFGIVMGDFVDKAARRSIAAAGCLAWSIMTAFCGLAGNFWHLFVMRVGVGLGEATLSPSAYSALPDLYPKERLARAASIYTMGAGAGAGLAMIIGGALVALVKSNPPWHLPVIGELRSWQTVFILVGAPGVLIALALRLLPEPTRKGAASVKPKWSDVLRFLSVNRTFMAPLFLGLACAAAASISTLSWGPALLMREYGRTVQDVGLLFGAASILCTCGGLGFGAALAERPTSLAREEHILSVCRFGGLIAVVGALCVAVFKSYAIAASSLGLVIFGANIAPGIGAAVLQMVTPNEMRGRVSALYLFTTTLVGIAFGPFLVGMLSDTVFEGRYFGYSMAVAGGLFGLSTIVLCTVARRARFALTPSSAARAGEQLA